MLAREASVRLCIRGATATRGATSGTNRTGVRASQDTTASDPAPPEMRPGRPPNAAVTKPIEVTELSQFIGLPDHFHLADCITNKEIPKNLSEADSDVA